MDFRNDNNDYGVKFVKQALANNLPSYIDETLSSDKISNITKLASNAFADEVSREYPINTKENTWLSAAYFYSQGYKNLTKEASSHIEQQIKLASLVHGIKEDIQAIISALSTQVKVASFSEEKEYAISIADKNYLPINTIDEVVASAKELDQNYLRLEPLTAKTAAINIVKKANDLGIATKEYLSSFILDKGVERLFNYDYAIKVAQERAEQTGCDIYKDIIEAANYAYSQGEDLTKYASEFYKLDSAHDIDYKAYGVQDPAEIFFNGITKQAAEAFSQDNVLVNGVFIPISEFKNKDFQNSVQSYFPKKVASVILEACKDDKTSIDMKIAFDDLSDNVRLDMIKLLAS